MRSVFQIAILFAALLGAITPIAFHFVPALSRFDSWEAAALCNAIAWLVVYVFVVGYRKLRSSVSEKAELIGIDSRRKGIEQLLQQLLHEVERKNASFSVNLVEQRIQSKQELSRALEKIVAQAYKLLAADSAELALYDSESGMYHSALVLGKPFRVNAQAMLSGASTGEHQNMSPDVLIQPIAFAGSVLGTLRVGLKSGTLPSAGDRDVMNLLALQAGLALMNANYSAELMRLRNNSEESVRAKTGFLANLSHEIRGPLGILLNAVELVLDGLCGPVNQDQQDTLRMAHSNGAHLLELINDVLDYAKVESGRINPNKVEILVQSLLEDITGVIRVQAEAKSHKVICKPSDDAMAIACDRRHARQMLINLLTNAVKYTPERGTIEVWAERIPGNRIKICVRDTGVGIDEADREKVFTAFERIEHSYSISQMGTGLGMPLTAKLAQVNGASIDFSSTPGKGTTFWLLFPAVDAKRVRLEQQPEETPEVDGKGNHLLIIERDPGERNMVVRYFTHVGFQVSSAATQIEAIEKLRQLPIELVVTGNDVADNPDEDLISIIRKNAKTPNLPIVLVSSRAFVFDIERYLKSGIDRCLMKPLKLKELAHTCRTLIDGTFSGEVLDPEAMNIPLVKEKKAAAEKRTEYTKVINVRDLTH